MPRYNVKSATVLELVRDALAPLYLETASIAAVAKLLNEALAAQGETRPLHPNRIHALLSNDLGRGVNELTIELIQRAVAAIRRTRAIASITSFDDSLADIARRAAPYLQHDANDLTEIARRVSVPPAILELALETSPGLAPIGSAPELSPQERRGGPDWTYQDVAISRCLDALRRRPTGNIGLILPTGAGKTRTALRIILESLAHAPSPTAGVIWVTHRKTLKAQAYRELGRLLEAGGEALPPDAVRLANRISFAMVGELEGLLGDMTEPPALVVVDEAHHAAAASYRSVFEGPHAFPVLLLTATPNRTDGMPIGIDEIAFTITYRELADRGAILVPKFEPFPVEDFQWSQAAVGDLADRLADETTDRFTKTLVLTQRIDQVRTFYEAFVARIESDSDHPLKVDDIGFIHGGGNSHGLENEDFLQRFATKPRAVLIAAQMLLEGFDDPTIDSVVITYETESVIKLMQAAGRCVRYAPGKTAAYVLQADNPGLAYRFDQRWLYQEIDDYLRPDLLDEEFSDQGELLAKAAVLLETHHVAPAERGAVLKALAHLSPGENPRLLFYGLPYFGDQEHFKDKAPWGVFVETGENSDTFRAIFNGFSALGAELSDPTEYLALAGPRHGLARDKGPGSAWRRMVEVLTAAYFAREELFGRSGAVQAGRPFSKHGPTTWLRYVVLHHHPKVPRALSDFLLDCHNRKSLEAAYLAEASAAALAIKTPLPLGGCEGLLLGPDQADELHDWLDDLRETLRLVDPARQLAELAARQAVAPSPRLPAAHLARADRLISESGRQAFSLRLNLKNDKDLSS